MRALATVCNSLFNNFHFQPLGKLIFKEDQKAALLFSSFEDEVFLNLTEIARN